MFHHTVKNSKFQEFFKMPFLQLYLTHSQLGPLKHCTDPHFPLPLLSAIHCMLALFERCHCQWVIFLSSHFCFFLLNLLPPFTVHCRKIFASPANSISVKLLTALLLVFRCLSLQSTNYSFLSCFFHGIIF